MPYCSNCDAEVGESDRVCPDCGATFGTDEESSSGVYSVRALGLGAAAAGTFLLLVLLAMPLTRPGPLEIRWLDVAFFGLYAAAAVGIWARTRTGYTVGAAVFGLVAAVSGLVVLGVLGRGPEGLVGWAPMDPLSLVLGLVQSVQVRSRSRLVLSGQVYTVATYAGTAGTAVLAGALWRRRATLPESTTDLPSGTAALGSLGVLLAGVAVAVAAPFVGVFGLPDVPAVGRLAIAAFPSPTAAVLGYLKFGQGTSLDPEINVSLLLAFGAIVPTTLLVDMVQMRRRTGWRPSALYLLGTLLLWFLTVPLYLYRRQKAA